MMRQVVLLLYCVVAAWVGACGTEGNLPAPNSAQLAFRLEISKSSISSMDELNLKITLQNQSASDLLVSRRLPWLPQKVAPEFAEVYVKILDSRGIPVENRDAKINYSLPGEQHLVVLRSGEQISKLINLLNYFQPEDFKVGEAYTVIATYQNSFELVKDVNGKRVSAWRGVVSSNRVTFVIEP